MVSGPEFRLLAELACQQATRQGHSRDDTHALFARSRQQLLDGLLPKDIKDDLQGGDALLFKADQAFFDGFHTGAKALDEPLVTLLAEPVKYLAFAQYLRGYTMQLRQIQTIDAKPFQRTPSRREHRFARVPVGIHPDATKLCCDQDVRVGSTEPAKRTLAFTIAISIGGIEKPDAGAVGGRKDFLRNRIIPWIAPTTPQLPAPETAFSDLKTLWA